VRTGGTQCQTNKYQELKQHTLSLFKYLWQSKNVYWTLGAVPNDSTSENFFTHYCHSTPKEYVRLAIQVLDASNNVVKALGDVAVNLELWVEQQTGPPVLDDGFRLEAFISNVGKAQRISRMQLHNGFGECFFRINQASSTRGASYIVKISCEESTELIEVQSTETAPIDVRSERPYPEEERTLKLVEKVMRRLLRISSLLTTVMRVELF
jgi:hypothetical protein